jgi:hypothetical protein
MPATLAMIAPTEIPTRSASVMPIANERKEINIAALNFSVGKIVIPAAITREKGGTIVESFAWPMISQTTNQITSEKKIGTLFPNNVISIPLSL